MEWSTHLSVSIREMPDRQSLLDQMEQRLPDLFLPNDLSLTDHAQQVQGDTDYDVNETSLLNILRLVPAKYSDDDLVIYQVTAPPFHSHGQVKQYTTRYVVFLPTGYSFCTCLRERNGGLTCAHQFAVFWNFPQQLWHITCLNPQWIIPGTALNLRDRPWIRIPAAEFNYAQNHPESAPPRTIAEPSRQPGIHPAFQPNRLKADALRAPPPRIHSSLQPNRLKADAVRETEFPSIPTPSGAASDWVRSVQLPSGKVGASVPHPTAGILAKSLRFATEFTQHTPNTTTPAQVIP
jgi:hypothetical protein